MDRSQARLDVRGLAVRGVTTDGSELYPEPLKELWPDVPHQVCEFHVIKEITKAVLHALAATRKKLRDRIPKQPRGRPRKAERAQSRKATRQQQQVSKLFEHRYLFVQHRLTADQKTTWIVVVCPGTDPLLGVTRGSPSRGRDWVLRGRLRRRERGGGGRGGERHFWGMRLRPTINDGAEERTYEGR